MHASHIPSHELFASLVCTDMYQWPEDRHKIRYIQNKSTWLDESASLEAEESVTEEIAFGLMETHAKMEKVNSTSVLVPR